MLQRDISSIMVSKEKTIFEVMKAINDSASKFALVVDDRERLEGIVTDGDIRRGFLNGHSSNEPIENIMNSSPVIAKENLSYEAIIDLVDEKFAQIPVLDKEGCIKGIITYKDKGILLDVKSRQICVLGLGFVGLTLSVVLAEIGFKVFGYDIDTKIIEEIKKGYSHFHEDGLDAYLNRYMGNNLIPVSDLSACNADIYIITVGTPVDNESKVPNIKYVEEAANHVAKYLKPDDLVLLRSTVPVGTTRNIVKPVLDKISGMRAGIDYYLAYAPERTIEGRAIPELRELPQVIGGYDTKSTAMVEMLFSKVTSTIIDVGSLEGAEMVKILNNTFRDVKFGYANEMALICKELGLDMVKLVNAANHGYVRDEIPVPSPGVGGACLTKDPYILMYSCKNLKNQPKIVKFARQSNELIPCQLVDEIHDLMSDLKKEPEKIFIIGFAFKGEPETTDTRGSNTIDLLNHLRRKGYKDESFFGYDPVVKQQRIVDLGVKPVTVYDGFKDADIVVFMNNHKSYKKLDIFSLLKTSKADCVFVDGWYIFEPRDINSINNIKYIGVGCRG